MSTSIMEGQDSYQYDIHDSTNDTEPECSLTVDHALLRNAIIIGMFFLVGFLGNFCLMMVIVSNPRLRTSANILLINLALGDLLYIILSGPFFIEHELHPCWQFGNAGCKLVNFTMVMIQGVCVYSLTALSIERYFVIVRGGTIRHASGRTRRAILSVCAVWVISAIVASPILYFAHLTEGYPSGCSYTKLGIKEAKVYEVTRALMMYLVPLGVITGLYAITAKTLLKSAAAFAGETQPGAHHFSARRRLALTVLILALLFGILWLPYYIFIIWFQLDNSSLINLPGISAFRFVYYFSALSNSCLDPLIIFAMSTTHRGALLNCFRRKSEGPTRTSYANMTPLNATVT